MGIRIFEPCDDPAGANCTLFDDPKTLHMAETKWYPSSLRIFDGSLVSGIFVEIYFLFMYTPLDDRWRYSRAHFFLQRGSCE